MEKGKKRFPLNLSYAFKGSINCYVHLVLNEEDESITLVSDYDEVIGTAYSGESLIPMLKDLSDDKYA